MAISGRKTWFKLDGVNISTYLDGVSPSNSQEELDGTTFQPDVANPRKDTVYGYEDDRYALSGKWTPAAELFFSARNGTNGLAYVYGPQGHTVIGSPDGQIRISGTCNVGKYSGPISTTSGITTFTAELAIQSRTVDTFDGSPD